MKKQKEKAEKDSFVFIQAFISRSRLQPEWGGMISIKTGCCLKASSCQAELPLRHRHHNRGCPSHNSVWLAQGENGSLRRVRPAAAWQVCICEAFTCYHSVCSTCQFPVFGKLPEQSDGENGVQGVKRKMCIVNILLQCAHPHTHKHINKSWIHN